MAGWVAGLSAVCMAESDRQFAESPVLALLEILSLDEPPAGRDLWTAVYSRIIWRGQHLHLSQAAAAALAGPGPDEALTLVYEGMPGSGVVAEDQTVIGVAVLQVVPALPAAPCDAVPGRPGPAWPEAPTGGERGISSSIWLTTRLEPSTSRTRSSRTKTVCGALMPNCVPESVPTAKVIPPLRRSRICARHSPDSSPRSACQTRSRSPSQPQRPDAASPLRAWREGRQGAATARVRARPNPGEPPRDAAPGRPGNDRRLRRAVALVFFRVRLVVASTSCAVASATASALGAARWCTCRPGPGCSSGRAAPGCP